MKHIILITFLFGFCMIYESNHAQITLTGEIRPRTEYRHGYKTLFDTGQTGSVFTEQRTRLNFNYAAPKLKVGISLQDVRVWGSQSQLNKTDGLTSIHEAWGEYLFSKKITAKLGRQELVYDDERLLGGVSWTQQGRSHDLLLLKFTDSTLVVHAGVAYNQNAEASTGTAYTVPGSYKEMQFLWVNKKIRQFSISVLALSNGVQSMASVHSTRYSLTAGPHLEYKRDKIFSSLRGYFQTGNDGATKKDLRAYFIGADFSYQVISKLSLGLGGEILSGQSQTDTTKKYRDMNHAFNPLYGTGHKFNGTMDYFYVGNHINTVGLEDIYLRVKYKAEKWWIGLDIHQFFSAAEVADQKILSAEGKYKAMNSSLGTEFDLLVGVNPLNEVSLLAGYSHMLGTETLGALKKTSHKELSNWMFLMITFKPVLFKN